MTPHCMMSILLLYVFSMVDDTCQAQELRRCRSDSQCSDADKPFCLGGQCKAPYCPGDASLGPAPQAKRSSDGRFAQCTLANAASVCAPAGPACPTCNTYYCETLERGFCCPNTKNVPAPCYYGTMAIANTSCSTYGPVLNDPKCPVYGWCSGRPGVCCVSMYGK